MYLCGQLNPSIRGGRDVDRYRYKRQPRLTISMPPPAVEEGESLLEISFNRSARVQRKSWVYSAIVWKLPEWTIVEAASEYAMDLTVNAAGYCGLLLGFTPWDRQTRRRIIIGGNSNLVIRQMQGEIGCKASGLQLLRHKALQRLQSCPKHEFLHMKRE